MKAFSLIRPQPHYRHDAFEAGLKTCGFDVQRNVVRNPSRDDVLIIWNRYWHNHDLANQFEALGARVLVAENPYLGLKDARGDPAGYAISLAGHNGSGQWYPGDFSRFVALGRQPLDWQRNDQGYILVCGQRGIGSPTMASPPRWHLDVAERLRKVTQRDIRIRYHPEDRQAPPHEKRPLVEDLKGAWACVIWSSSSGCEALMRGVPVFYDAPHWICQSAAQRGIDAIERPLFDDEARLAGLREMAWAQWSVDEITSGQPFRHLLR